MAKIRCISADIFRSRDGDCSNDGISNRFTEILIPHERGWIEIDSEDLPENYCEPEISYGRYLHFIPVNLKGRCAMFGGCFAWTSDSRFREDYCEYPVQIHDRIES